MVRVTIFSEKEFVDKSQCATLAAPHPVVADNRLATVALPTAQLLDCLSMISRLKLLLKCPYTVHSLSNNLCFLLLQ